MTSSLFDIALPDAIAIALLIGGVISLYISLSSKITEAESNSKHWAYKNELTRERINVVNSELINVTASISRIERVIELATQQTLSDKDAALSHRNGLQELIEHRSKRWEAELSKVELELKTDVATLRDESYRAITDLNKQLSDISSFLIKKSDFNSRESP
ncbi:hypothetical protein [Chlorogloea sp. CCALA 695]|uniref:hypothetical protein n=1 Tax=Chlorogloea sp. CCALA 695 TaxID=2107693 RepID=UPI000D04F839|nr:hypothetical protein [Chlorogloea sp. CCALA 695]PSB27472.1 hypothetical protein C7B70_22480 [Chlorogloea sp. CCALA 695]